MMTRRHLLQSAAAAALASRRLAAAELTASPLMTRLSDYMAAAAVHPFARTGCREDEAVHSRYARRHDFRFFTLPPGKFAIQFARSYRAGRRSERFAGSNVLCGPIEAALSNGMLAHSDETDDTHPPSQSHPGASVVPSALAAGEQFNNDGARFLRAVALGYDIGPRVTITLGKLQYMVDTHRSTHALRAPSGRPPPQRAQLAQRAADALAPLLHRPASRRPRLLAARHRSHRKILRLRRHARPQRRHLRAPSPSRRHRRRRHPFGSRQFPRRLRPQKQRRNADRKTRRAYEVTRTKFKKWTVGAPIQAPLDAMENILKRTPFAANQVKQVTVRVAADEATIVDNRTIPDICLQHLIAVMVLDRNATLARPTSGPDERPGRARRAGKETGSR